MYRLTTERQGRYVIAREKIEKDELIVKETAFAFVPVYSNYNQDPIDLNCQNCGKTNIIPFPCNTCGRASYCSITCRMNHNYCHKIECPGYKINLWYSIGIAHLAMRTFLTGFKEMIEKLRKRQELKTPEEIFIELAYLSAEDRDFRYGQVFRLATNFDKMNRDDLKKYWMTAVMMTIYLRDFADFFRTLPKFAYKMMPMNDWEYLVGALIMRHMGQLVCNGHAISELKLLKPYKIIKANTIQIGYLSLSFESGRIFTGIFPKISMFNHSCNPNIRNHFDKNGLTVYATREIKCNAEIFNCYGPMATFMRKEERKVILKQQYCFDCECEKCTSLIDESDGFNYYICQAGKCGEIIPEQLINAGWWRNDDRQIPVMPVQCPKCTSKMNFEWYRQLNNTLLSFRMPCTKIDSRFLEIFNLYQKGKKFLSQNHEMKEFMTFRILEIFAEPNVLSTGRYFDTLYKIAAEHAEIKIKRYGIKSFEYILAATYMLDIAALKKSLNLPIITVDMKNINSAIEILSEETKVYFVKYISDNIGIGVISQSSVLS